MQSAMCVTPQPHSQWRNFGLKSEGTKQNSWHGVLIKWGVRPPTPKSGGRGPDPLKLRLCAQHYCTLVSAHFRPAEGRRLSWCQQDFGCWHGQWRQYVNSMGWHTHKLSQGVGSPNIFDILSSAQVVILVCLDHTKQQRLNIGYFAMDIPPGILGMYPPPLGKLVHIEATIDSTYF